MRIQTANTNVVQKRKEGTAGEVKTFIAEEVATTSNTRRAPHINAYLQEVERQVLINFHDRRLVAAAVAVVGRTEDGHDAALMCPGVALHGERKMEHSMRKSRAPQTVVAGIAPPRKRISRHKAPTEMREPDAQLTSMTS